VVIINASCIHVGTPTGDFHPITSRPCWAHTLRSTGRCAIKPRSAGDLHVSPLMSRSALLRILVGLLVAAAVAAAIPFVSSLTPSAKVQAERPRVKIPNLGPSQFTFTKDPTWETGELMFVRKPDGTLDVWRLLTRNGKRTLPDLHWWRPGQECDSFGPDFAKGIITCYDQDLSDWMKENYVWSLDGKNLGKQADNMERMDGYEEFGDYVFGKKPG
jgi:hypothetical protein